VTCWAIIPVKAPDTAKLRLAAVLSPGERARLVAAMLDHVVATCSAANHVAQTCLVGPSRHGQPSELVLLDDPGLGLNAVLTAALDQAEAGGAQRVIVVPGDLPQVTVQDLELLAVVPATEIGIAPDRHGTGTNALSLPLPAARGFRFAFGDDSFALHQAEAARLGLAVEVIHSPTLAKDIDVPADLADADALLGE
jgi:2-phospho-L-lactate guanylyltransferase